MRTRSLNHSQYQTEYHIVWGTRYRRKYLKEYAKQELRKYLYTATKKYPTLFIHSFNTNEDHVHLQIEIPPNLSVAAVVQKLKAESSYHLKKEFRFIRDMYIDGSIWSVGYFVSTVGLNEQQIKRYIANQGKKDRGPPCASGSHETRQETPYDLVPEGVRGGGHSTFGHLAIFLPKFVRG